MNAPLIRSSQVSERRIAVFRWLTILALVYLLLVGVGDISSGFRAAIGDEVEQLFTFAKHPVLGLMIGMLATTLIQSSSTTVAIIVGLVAGGLPVPLAVPMVMGANIGTSVAAGIVSLGYPSDEQQFRKAFSAATVLDLFNLLAILIFFPLESLLHPLEWLSVATTKLLFKNTTLNLDHLDHLDFVRLITSPARSIVKAVIVVLPDPFSGIVQLLTGAGLIFVSIYFISKLLRRLMLGRIKGIYTALGRGSIAGMLAGMIVTVLMQSSAATTSLMVPFASSGVFGLEIIYPFTLGANLGTPLTALMAASAIVGYPAFPALEIALVHLFFNLLSIFVIFGISFLRPLPVIVSKRLATAASENHFIAFAYIIGVFLVLPLTVLLLSILF